MSAELFVYGGRKLVGARWRHYGRTPWAVDCLGVLVLAAAHAGLPFEDEPIYSQEPIDGLLRAGLQRRFGPPVPGGFRSMRQGDVPLFRWGNGPPTHVGIAANHPSGGLSLIHSNIVNGCVEQSFSKILVAAFVDCYRPSWNNAWA
jgi:hypothetical protein